MYRSDKAIDKLLEGMGDREVTTLTDAPPPEELNISEADASQKPVVRLVDMIISEGILSRASDIHVEPEEGGVAVRYRIDGVLRQVMKIPRQAGLLLISRIKIMSSLDIADRLRPQDGRARVAVNGQPIDEGGHVQARTRAATHCRQLDLHRTQTGVEAFLLKFAERAVGRSH